MTPLRIEASLRGLVQGVGFRPFVFRLATQLGLAGSVRNSPVGVEIEVQGSQEQLDLFFVQLEAQKPALSFFSSLEKTLLPPRPLEGFVIQPSATAGPLSALVLPDLATCPACLEETFDPKNRRYRYPFTNCTHCGPRYSILEALPYDRPLTSMKGFAQCPRCLAEYEDPADRRFHAQPNACPVCGPHLSLYSPQGERLAEREQALELTLAALEESKVVAVKGLGGFLLLVRADAGARLLQLRQNKARAAKPFALMVPNLDWAHRLARIGPEELAALTSIESPIVLLQTKPEAAQWVADTVAPGCPELGLMLPYSPLHHLILKDLDLPLVATSGNLGGEPIYTDLPQVLERLGGLVDLVLDHNRPIVRPVEDSLVRVLAGRRQVLRRARGYAPLPLEMPLGGPGILALGGQQKVCVALNKGNLAFVGNYLGDLDNPRAQEGFERAVAEMPQLLAAPPTKLAFDRHPSYFGHQWAKKQSLPQIQLGHHRSHLWALLAESGILAPVLGFAWDGTGLGDDGLIWGSEVFAGPPNDLKRLAFLPPFPLPGAEAAMREPLKIAYALFWTLAGAQVFDRPQDYRLPPLPQAAELKGMLEKNLHCPKTTSMGRLFDGVSAWLGCCTEVTFEGQGAMKLEWAARRAVEQGARPSNLGTAPMDWPGLLGKLLELRLLGENLENLAARFHTELAHWIIGLAAQQPEEAVLLSGGCFLNRLLSELAVEGLTRLGKQPVLAQRFPPNDGALALGQLYGALLQQESHVPSPTG